MPETHLHLVERFPFEWRKDPPPKHACKVESKESWRLLFPREYAKPLFVGRAGAVFDMKTLSHIGWGWYTSQEAESIGIPPKSHQAPPFGSADDARKDMQSYCLEKYRARQKQPAGK